MCVEPLGAASFAQVHRARLCKDGSEVAIKIQHPDVKTNSYTDLKTIDVSYMCVMCSYLKCLLPQVLVACSVPCGMCACHLSLLPFPMAGR